MPPRPPSLRSIAAFEAAARHQSFSKAAAELNLTHGAISHSVRGLELRLGRRLFDRSGGRVRLTEDGVLLANRVRTGVGLIADAFDTTTDQAGSPRLTVSVLPSFASRVLIPRLADFYQTFPRTELVLRCSSRLESLEDDGVDLGVRFGPGNWAGLQSRHLAQEYLVVVASPYFRRGALPRTLNDILACDLIDHPGSSWRLWLSSLGYDGAFRARLSIDDSAIALEAAAAGQGVVLARQLLVEGDLKAGRLVQLMEHRAPAEYNYWCVWNASSPRIEAIRRFTAWLVGQLS